MNTEEYEKYELEDFEEEFVPLVGRRLPDFELLTLQDGERKAVKLSDYAGKWLILMFYPGDFTFICPTELEDAADHYDEFVKEGAEIISVSTDSVYVHKAWHDQSKAIQKVTFPMASDRPGRLSRALGVYLEETGEALRGSFIIDPDGVIKSMEVNDNNVGRNARELLRKLKAAKVAYESKGEFVCPAKWEEGGDTLKPGMDLVGKI